MWDAGREAIRLHTVVTSQLPDLPGLQGVNAVEVSRWPTERWSHTSATKDKNDVMSGEQTRYAADCERADLWG